MTTVEFVTVHTTTDSAAEAERLASMAVAEQLAACVQVCQVTSYYRWQGETHQDPEYLLTLKTESSAIDRIKALFAAEHSYDEPEVIVQPIIDGSEAYLQWIRENTTSA
ncbi:divalent-cation tolerance protein CutA [Nesterenkonia sphaerica]|uniref:Divalent-cation tolerance protein CutA n=1 Tax=Nesterenkonia sphaerica TaxID=1804988 RepID=A0A5R8ZY10_9MICC|nr:divalent-cation tolerance protein CutA [Nesterenkonia sphaerica]TLP71150.1 divalent-cation tolerance protein CutA [Nesterenkonia sphaerica]